MDFLAAAAHKSGGLSLDPIAKPIAWVLAHIYAVVPNYGVAIMVLSVIWMVIIAPLTLKTTRSMLAMQKLQPEIKKLQDQHRNDRAALSQATMDLYKEKGVSPFGSCLPTLLPLPVFFALFRVINGLSHTTAGQAAPKYLAHTTRMYKDIVTAHGHINAFGVDLAKNATSAHSGVFSALPYFLLILLMMGTQYLQTVQMMNRNPANANNPQAKMMKYLPLIFGVFMIRFPAGVVLYYAMSNVCRIAQQTLMYRYDPKVRALAVQDMREVEAETRDIESGKRKREPLAPPPPPSPKSRFRDLLASAAEQKAKAKDERDNGKRPSNGSVRPPSTPKGVPTKPRGANGTRDKGRPPPAVANGPVDKAGKSVPAPVDKASKGGPADGSPTRGAAGSRAAKGSPTSSKAKGSPGGARAIGNGSTNGATPPKSDARPDRSADDNEGGAAATGNMLNGNGSAPPGANGNSDGAANRPRTGAGAGGRTGADRNRNRKRRGR